MTERGGASLSREAERIAIGGSAMEKRDGALRIDFHEIALPWPGQRLLPKAISGTIALTAETRSDELFVLDAEGHHAWSPRMPRATATIACAALPGGGWTGRAYHDMNFGDRPIEQDFIGWDWARGSEGADGDTVILYDAVLRDGGSRRLGLRCTRAGAMERFELPARQDLSRAFWGVRSGVACDDGVRPVLKRRLEDSPFYTRALAGTVVGGRSLDMVHETLDCRRLANPVVRMMLPFRMPRWTRA